MPTILHNITFFFKLSLTILYFFKCIFHIKCSNLRVCLFCISFMLLFYIEKIDWKNCFNNLCFSIMYFWKIILQQKYVLISIFIKMKEMCFWKIIFVSIQPILHIKDSIEKLLLFLNCILSKWKRNVLLQNKFCFYLSIVYSIL